MIGETRTTLLTEQWLVLRTGRLEEVVQDTGRIVYRVKVWDDEREAFITQTFNDEGVARSFLERLKAENTSYVNNYEKENGK